MTLFTLPFPEGFRILSPEQAVIEFPGKGTLDIGSLCFIKRTLDGPSRRRTEGRRVDISSIDLERTEQVRMILQYVADRYTHGGISPATAHFETSIGIVNFMDWADAAGHCRACYDEHSARAAFVDYVEGVWERFHRKEIKSGTAARYCNYPLQFLSNFLEVDDLQQGVNLPQKSNNDSQPTVPPVEENQAKALSLAYSFFDGLTDFVLNKLDYPYQLKLPKYLGWPNSWMWIFPMNEWFRTPFEIEAYKSKKDHSSAYNFYEGRVNSLHEILNKHSLRCNAQQSVRRAITNLSVANGNVRHTYRLASGMQSLQAFTLLFIAYTGINLEQARTLEWDGEYEVSTERQKFRVIKWRANGKLQSFEIQPTFLSDFKRFLKLRSFLLNGRECRWLFFSLGIRGLGQPGQMKYYAPRQIYQRLMRIDPALPVITPRQWRSANVAWMLRKNVPLSVAADVVQNSEETLKRAYVAGSFETHRAEMTAFLDKVSSVVLEGTQAINGIQEGPVGRCTDYGRPKSDGTSSLLSPDCRNPEGCFFCDNYKVHADEHDIRKLISCRFCIQKTSSLAASVEHFESVFGGIISRINELLVEIGKRIHEPELISKITRSVEEFGELDNYWGAKLELLIQLELISA